MTEIKLVIFDCDGVLINSEYVAARHELRRYGEFGLEMSVEEFSARFSGMTGEAIFRAVEEALGRSLPEGLHREIEAELDQALDAEAQLIEGADTVLDRLDQARCICSNSAAGRLKRMLEKVGLYDRFRPYVFSARDLDPPAPKPAPGIFLKAMAEFGVAPNETLVIEDLVHGVAGAARAGARIVGFTGGRHTYPMHGEQLSQAGAETVIGRLADLPAIVDAFGVWAGLGAA